MGRRGVLIPFVLSAVAVGLAVGCDRSAKHAGHKHHPTTRPAEASADAAFIDWVEAVDADLERDYQSYETDDDGRVVYVDLQEAEVGNADLARVGELTHLRELNASANPDITDDGLKHLSKLAALERLDLSFTNINDAGLVHLRPLARLRVLVLDGLDDEQITDVGLRHLLPLADLEELRLNSADITDASVETLAQFKHLKRLDISETQITDEGAERLQEALPECKVERDSEV